MKKSVFTFGLLASSLMMLAVMPLLNNNSAMAQEYDKYGDSSYSTHPTEDKKYECRTGPAEGFFVSSVEFCKHIKFDDKKDNNRDNGTQGPPGVAGPAGPKGDTGIQGLPGPAGGQPGPQGPSGPPGVPGAQGERGLTGATGMTGPASTVPGPQGLRGFNGTDGVNGMQGIQGLRGFNGTDGVNGTQGPAGPNQINSTNLYRVIGNTANIQPPAGTLATSIASCESGDVVIEGGYMVLVTSNNAAPIVFADGPLPNAFGGGPNDSGYYVQLISTGITNSFTTFIAYAYCFNNSP